MNNNCNNHTNQNQTNTYNKKEQHTKHITQIIKNRETHKTYNIQTKTKNKHNLKDRNLILKIKEKRKNILINDHRSVELDFSGLHINLAYGLEGFKPLQEEVGDEIRKKIKEKLSGIVPGVKHGGIVSINQLVRPL